ncbi:MULTISPECIES: terminase small subunit [Caproicibacterium]|uniref:Uncharacterized protein n=1 Tax=Caproicibacterium argilliputei TaxID=3030016 RepID=A0AA97H184_9FIRM|nr:terminase small subunit [Caproicibacterium argilliputei]WOC32158.1 hypothetical protein PXC00_13360 [Caproicibacterium argilliputei]
MDTRKEALQVCRRLARGRINDAVRLLFEPQEPECLRKLDLYCVAEVKRSDKGVEIKFADRLKAAQMLAQLGGEESVQPLFAALNQSAQAVKEVGRGGGDAV